MANGDDRRFGPPPTLEDVTNGGGFVPPIDVSLTGAASNPDTLAVEELLSRLDLPEPPEEPKFGVGRNIAGGLGDALATFASMLQGGGPQSPFAQNKARVMEQFRRESAAVDAERRGLNNRIVLAQHQRRINARPDGTEVDTKDRTARVTQRDINKSQGRIPQSALNELWKVRDIINKQTGATESSTFLGPFERTDGSTEKSGRGFRPVVDLVRDEDGNMFYTSAVVDSQGVRGDPELIPLPGSPDAPVGRLVRSTQTDATMAGPEGTYVLDAVTKRPKGLLGEGGTIVPITRQGGPAPGQQVRTKIADPGGGPDIPIPPTSTESNVNAIQGEQNLLSHVNGTLALALSIMRTNPQEKRLALKFLSKVPVVGDEIVGTIDEDTRVLQGKFSALRSAIDEESSRGRLTRIRKAELDSIMGSQAEDLGSLVRLLLDLRESVTRKIELREKLQPGLTGAIKDRGQQ